MVAGKEVVDVVKEVVVAGAKVGIEVVEEAGKEVVIEEESEEIDVGTPVERVAVEPVDVKPHTAGPHISETYCCKPEIDIA